MKNKKINALKNNIYFIGKIWMISPWRVFHAFLSQILEKAVGAFFTVVFMRYLFGANEFTHSFGDVTVFLIVVSAVILVISIYNTWYKNIFIRREDQRIAFALNRELFDKATTVDISCYDNPEFYDQYTKAAGEASGRANSVLGSCAGLASSLGSAIFVIYNLISINFFIGLLVILPLIGTFKFGKMVGDLYYDRTMEHIPYGRRMGYVNRVMHLQQYAKEIRLTNIFTILRKIYDTAFNGIIKTNRKYSKRIFWVDFLCTIFNMPLIFEFAYLFAAWLAMVKMSITVGVFIMIANAVVSTTWMLMGIRGGLLDIIRNSVFIENLKSFLYYTPKINENQPGLQVDNVDVLEFQSVSFKYTDDGRYVLHKVSLTVKAGEKICIVGHNGAGKTTLIKLAMRLYDPTEGKILLNGVDIREYEVAQYRAMIGVAFQDFQMFSVSVAENVIMKRVDTLDERERVLDALQQSGISDKIDMFPNKEDTIMTREFDDNGVILSGGEYQKVAIARAFAKNARILILDEPSSSLDPIAEYMMNETIMRLCKRKDNIDKIAIIISHRLSLTVGADRIYMLEQGEVVEYGSHKELLSQGGAYADMYMKQAENYLAGEVSYGK